MKLHLLYNQKTIQINSTNNVIGRNETYGISDAEISRKHLLIDQINNTIVHTGITKAYLDGKVIPNTPIPIVNGDRIKLSSCLEILVELTFEISDESDYVIGSGYDEDADTINVKDDLEELPEPTDFNYGDSSMDVDKPPKKPPTYGYGRSSTAPRKKAKGKRTVVTKEEKPKRDASIYLEGEEESNSEPERIIKKPRAPRKARKRLVQSDSETSDMAESPSIETQPIDFSLTQQKPYSQTQPRLEADDHQDAPDSDVTEDLNFSPTSVNQTLPIQDDDSTTASLSDSELADRE
ncbi:hypothetical protein HDV06_003163 [Boothiomyces sp. JEL0866]|nr:hypothetical protein HDV06_003163 [Boothiomyces sp. JEL0866]